MIPQFRMINALRSKAARRRWCQAAGLGFSVLSVLLFLASSFLTASQPQQVTALLPPSEREIQHDFSGDLYFNAEPDAQPIAPLLVEAIHDARERVTLAMFSFQWPEVAQALQAAHDRGVMVTVILDKSNHRRHQWVFESHPELKVIELGSEAGDSVIFMHHKFLLIDEGTPTARIFYGALNFTVLQENMDPGFMLETSDSAFIAPFAEEAERLRSGLHGRAKFRAGFRPGAATLRYPNGWLEVWFSPGFRENSAKTRYLELLNGATRSIDVAIWVLTDGDIASTLAARAAAGVSVRVIADDAFFWGPDSALPFLDKAARNNPEQPLEVVNDTIKTIQQLRTVQPGIPLHTSYLHQHFAVIDQEILITGTNNWSDNGFLMNDESIIVTNIPFLVESFAEWWDRQYQALRGAKLIVQWENDRARLDPTQIIDAVSFQIYTESVAFGDQPALCFEASGAELSQTLKVPEFCRTPRNHAFLLDANGNILAGNYN